jgi:hypothetical protein
MVRALVLWCWRCSTTRLMPLQISLPPKTVATAGIMQESRSDSLSAQIPGCLVSGGGGGTSSGDLRQAQERRGRSRGRKRGRNGLSSPNRVKTEQAPSDGLLALPSSLASSIITPTIPAPPSITPHQPENQNGLLHGSVPRPIRRWAYNSSALIPSSQLTAHNPTSHSVNMDTTSSLVTAAILTHL